MIRQHEMLWDSSNDYDTEIKYKKGTIVPSANQGVCAGLAIEWCKNILKGIRPELSKPFLLQGMIYQRFYDWGKDDAERNGNLFSKASVSSQDYKKCNTARLSAAYIFGKQGVFWADTTCTRSA